MVLFAKKSKMLDFRKSIVNGLSLELDTKIRYFETILDIKLSSNPFSKNG